MKIDKNGLWIKSLIEELDEFYKIHDLYEAGELPIKAMKSASVIVNCFPKRFRPEIRKNDKKTGLLLYWQLSGAYKTFQFGFSIREEGWRGRLFIERIK